MTARRYFGTDGIRGRVGEPPITPELVLKLGWAAGRVLAIGDGARKGESPRVLIGKDTRISGYLLEAALEAGLVGGRCRRLSVRAAADAGGRLPDACAAAVGRHRDQRVAQSVRRQRHQVLLGGRREAARRRRAGDRARDGRAARVRSVGGARQGAAHRRRGGPLRRVLQEHVSRPSSTSRGWRIVVDCANGAGYHVAPPVFHELGADVVAVGVEPDGLNINAGVGATHPQFLAEQVQRARGAISASRSTATATGC